MDVPCSHVALKNNDALYEILVRVNPYDIFNCILVSKDWLRVITHSAFWTNYINVWKNSSCIVLGLLRIPYELYSLWLDEVTDPIKMLPTNNMGRNINTRTLSQKPRTSCKEFFLSKSSKGGLLLLGSVVMPEHKTFVDSIAAALPKTFLGCIFPKKEKFEVRFSVCNPFSRSRPIELPPPPVNCGSCMVNIMSCDGGEFKVVLAKGWCMDNKVSIQIYCSRKRKWEEQFTPNCSTDFCLVPYTMVEPGRVSSGGGVIYWRAYKIDYTPCFAVWDINEGSFNLIPQPPHCGANVPPRLADIVIYGVSPHPRGSLLAATGHWNSEGFKIWALDDDRKDWFLLYSVSQESLWDNNSQLLTSLFEVRPNLEFEFVSFFPENADCFFVGLGRHLFFHRFHSGKLEYVEYTKYSGHMLASLYGSYNKYHPLTMLDFRGPSSPPCLQLPRSS